MARGQESWGTVPFDVRSNSATWVLLLLFLGLIAGQQTLAGSSAPTYGYRVIERHPHDARAFTQGLVYANGFLYESTGRHGASTLRKVRPETGEIIRQRALPDRYFAEGLTSRNGRLVQLTWRSNTGFVYDRASLRRLHTFSYPDEGWGLTDDGDHLIMSDGSDTLRFLDPDTFEEHRRVRVMDGGESVNGLNELEYVGNAIYANVRHTNRIVMIAPDSGRVVGWIDLTGLLRSDQEKLNGIAYDEDNDRLFVTGKLWPNLFEIELMRR